MLSSQVTYDHITAKEKNRFPDLESQFVYLGALLGLTVYSILKLWAKSKERDQSLMMQSMPRLSHMLCQLRLHQVLLLPS